MNLFPQVHQLIIQFTKVLSHPYSEVHELEMRATAEFSDNFYLKFSDNVPYAVKKWNYN